MAYDPNMTPGSAVADQLQEILARRRADARQQLLDQIGAAQAASEMDYRAKSAASLEESRQASAEQRRAQAAKTTADANELARRQKAMNDFQIPADADEDIETQFNTAKQLGDWDLFKTVLTNMGNMAKKRSGGDMFIVHPGGRLEDTGIWNDNGPVFHQLPQPNASGTPQMKPAGRTEDGSLVFTSNRMGPDGMPVLIDQWGSPYTGKVLPLTGGSKQPGRNVTPAEAAKLAILRGKAMKQGTFFGGGPKDEDVQAYNQMLETIISNYPTTPDVRDTVRDVEDKEPGTPLPELLERMRSAFSDPQEFEQFSDLMHVIRVGAQ